MRQKFSWKLYVKLSTPSAEMLWSFKDTAFVLYIVFKQNADKYHILIKHKTIASHRKIHSEARIQPSINPMIRNCKNTEAKNELHEASVSVRLRGLYVTGKLKMPPIFRLQHRFLLIGTAPAKRRKNKAREKRTAFPENSVN